VAIVVDRDRCVGAGLCVWTLPTTFDQSEEDGRVVYFGQDTISPDQEHLSRQAASLCPSGAISLTEEEPVS
jgi:ferredoxin